ncbi:hypothetical protein GALL_457360 [mine drainage metagenome]|uniref:Uncharacterized protein n=1 Tax=mine drainage metagenome TaxID=410659 RepID=A0A1J5PPA8_9ZZZZ
MRDVSATQRHQAETADKGAGADLFDQNVTAARVKGVGVAAIFAHAATVFDEGEIAKPLRAGQILLGFGKTGAVTAFA